MEIVLSFDQTQHFLRKLDTAGTAFAPYLGERHVDAERFAFFSDQRKLRLGIGREAVNRDNTWETKIARDIFDMLQQVRQTLSQCLEIFVV